MPDDSHDDVRARLAAEPTPPMPDDVAARLHETLAAEAQARAGSQSDEAAAATVTPLRRRGRWKAPLLAAAGVVAVVAIGIPVINQTSSDQAGDADGGSGGTLFSSESSGSGSADGSGQNDQSAPQAEPDSTLRELRKSPMDLHRATFESDVAGHLSSLQSDAPLSATRLSLDEVTCQGGRPRASGALPARLDGDPAVVLTSPTPSAGMRVRAVVCSEGTPKVAARATLD